MSDKGKTIVDSLKDITREDIFPKEPHNGFCHFCEGTQGGIRTHIIGCPQPVMDDLAEKTRPYREELATIRTAATKLIEAVEETCENFPNLPGHEWLIKAAAELKREVGE